MVINDGEMMKLVHRATETQQSSEKRKTSVTELDTILEKGLQGDSEIKISEDPLCCFNPTHNDVVLLRFGVNWACFFVDRVFFFFLFIMSY